MTLREVADRPPATSPARAGARRSRRRPREPENTPAHVRALAFGFAILVTALVVLVSVEVRRERTGLRVIGYETAPVVIASTDLYFALNDMDAQLANVLLVGRETDLGFTRSQALDIYHQRRQQVSQDLQRAAAAADADSAAAASIRDILDALGDYEELAAQMLLLDQQNPHAAGQPSATTLALYRQATDLLKARLLPPAQHLTDRNAAILESTYETQRGHALIARDLIAGLGLVILAAAIVLQVYLARRFHRWVNPAVGLAALIAIALATAGVVLTTNGAEYFRAAKKDAFDSILALDSARAVSYDANADESRYLVDPQRADQYEKAFLTKTLQLVNLRGATLATFDQRLDTALQGYRKGNQDVEWYGYYGTEFRNITFTGERAAAELTLKRYQVYQVDDRKIRRLATTGHLRESIAFCTSYNPGDSNWAFDQYDKALAALIGINQNAFNRSIRNGEHALDGWTVIPAVAGLAILGLLLLGLRGRFAEYHVAAR